MSSVFRVVVVTVVNTVSMVSPSAAMRIVVLVSGLKSVVLTGVVSVAVSGPVSAPGCDVRVMGDGVVVVMFGWFPYPGKVSEPVVTTGVVSAIVSSSGCRSGDVGAPSVGVSVGSVDL